MWVSLTWFCFATVKLVFGDAGRRTNFFRVKKKLKPILKNVDDKNDKRGVFLRHVYISLIIIRPYRVRQTGTESNRNVKNEINL